MNKRKEWRRPQRTCVVCGSKKAKADLLRLALDGDNRVCLDHGQRCHGRGAYVCHQPKCLTGVKLAQLQKAFRRSLNVDAWNRAQAMAEALHGCSDKIHK